MWRVEEQAPEALFAVAGITDLGYSVPLAPMTLPERVRADYETMNLTTAPNRINLLRESFPSVWRATDLTRSRHGATIQIADIVIGSRRIGTAKGLVLIIL